MSQAEIEIPATDTRARELYLDLMKRCLLNTLYAEYETKPFVPCGKLNRRLLNWFSRKMLAPRNARIVQTYRVDSVVRQEGRDWPAMAHTMIGAQRLDNIRFCVEDILEKNVPGDFIETGVWRGGASIFMRAILKAHGVDDRSVWLADSFEGLPAPDAEKYPHDKGINLHTFDELAVPLKKVKENFAKYNLLDDQVKFLKGWFKDTLPGVAIEKIALLRLDGDLYESTMNGLKNLYPKVSAGGYVIVDDYLDIPACRQAVTDYRTAHGITEEIIRIDQNGAYWRKDRS
jgi:hypothetical protein